MGLRTVTVQRTVDAPPEAIFDVLADPAEHSVIDGSGTVRASHGTNPERLSLGAKFGMDMKAGAPYRVTNKVVEFTEGSQIAWRHFNGHVWRYTLEAVAGGTRVTEQWDPTHAKNKWFLALVRFPSRNETGMRRTLDNLAARFAG